MSNVISSFATNQLTVVSFTVVASFFFGFFFKRYLAIAGPDGDDDNDENEENEENDENDEDDEADKGKKEMPSNNENENEKQEQPKKAVKKLYREDFEWGKVIGEGAYGEVQLATEKNSGVDYAVKILNKKHIIQNKKVEWVNREKVLLDKLRHPNIINLYYTFSDPERLHFVLEYCPFGELLDKIREVKAFNLESAKFYSAEIISALEFMHNNKVAHRDIKPENMLLGDNMHLKIIDFGTAKEIGGREARSKSFVGTAEYVCPELLDAKEAGLSADLWSLGCTIYQLLAGRPPFKAMNEYLTFQKILKKEFVYPENFPDVGRDLIDQLLELDPEKRLGNREEGGYEELKNHEFFEGIDWENLSTTTPPEIAPPDELPIFPEAPKPPEPEAILTKEEEDKIEREKKLKEQKESVWNKFLDGKELIIHTGLLSKKRGFSTKKRQFILTDAPKLIYVDADKMEIKGEVPLDGEVKIENKNSKSINIIVPGRTYELRDNSSQAKKWAEEIQKILPK
eukprot:TRINITY_DN400_c0_g3_i1.p1 TRINITY_DN400_c0_g3~~TRINITY_DN400_c0_g3_i1.p1  ORF type:complete len:513 (+),score=225.01 TRINITY_DN400_c0_g3_i1:218-1756(+)